MVVMCHHFSVRTLAVLWLVRSPAEVGHAWQSAAEYNW